MFFGYFVKKRMQMQAGEIDGSILGAGMWPVCGSNFINRDRTSPDKDKTVKK
jgi:hypothetical protein